MSKIGAVKSKESAFPCILKNASFHFVESYNSLRTNIRFASVDRQYQKIVITSSISGEGKSTVAIDLAIALAHPDSRVLLIDCDLRKPALMKYLSIDTRAPGLTNALVGIADVENCIVHLYEKDIDFIPSGPIPPNPPELLGSGRMSEIIEILSKRYDYILFDTPPVSVVTDAAVLSKFSDGVIFVIKHHFTTIEDAQLAKTNLSSVGATVIGTVLNNFNAKNSSLEYESYHKQYKYGYR